jgi:hypothetical protein
MIGPVIATAVSQPVVLVPAYLVARRAIAGAQVGAAT